MSTDLRLARLGLLHLKDKPTELQQALETQLGDSRSAEQSWHDERAALLAQLKRGELPRVEPRSHSTAGRSDPDRLDKKR